jgi:hypothetical protein
VLIGVRQGQRRDAAATGEEQIARCAAGKSKYTRLYLCSGKLTIETIYPRRVRVAGLSFSAVAPALTHVCTAGDYGENSAWASGGPARCWRVAACMGRWRALPQHGPPRRVQRPHMPYSSDPRKPATGVSWHAAGSRLPDPIILR